MNKELNTPVNYESGTRITFLTNAGLYNLSRVLIVLEPTNTYRLLVIKRDRVLTDARYPSLRGARIAYTRTYGSRLFTELAAPFWSHSYAPDPRWLSNLIQPRQSKQTVKGFQECRV